jgi:hypothetical protein
MDWRASCAYVIGTVNQELLARSEYAEAMEVGVDLGFVALELSQLAIKCSGSPARPLWGRWRVLRR